MAIAMPAFDEDCMLCWEFWIAKLTIHLSGAFQDFKSKNIPIHHYDILLSHGTLLNCFTVSTFH